VTEVNEVEEGVVTEESTDSATEAETVDEIAEDVAGETVDEIAEDVADETADAETKDES